MAKKPKNERDKSADTQAESTPAASKKQIAKAEEAAAAAAKAAKKASLPTADDKLKLAKRALKASQTTLTSTELLLERTQTELANERTAHLDEVTLLKKALRKAQRKLTDTEVLLERVTTELVNERTATEEQAIEIVEEAVVEAAVAETLAEAVAAAAQADVPEDVLVEEAAETLDAIVAEVEFAAAALEPQFESAGDAEAAAEVFEAELPATASLDLTPPLPDKTVVTVPDGEPGPTWTVLQLRTAARQRGLRGYSTASKTDLLEKLRG